MLYAATGHRPDKLHAVTQWDRDALHNNLTQFAVEILVARGTTHGISGMALGWDTAFACACVRLNIPFIAAIPFVGQEKLWRGADQILYRELLEKAARVEVICPHTLTVAYQLRNEWMADQADRVGGRILGLFNGTPGGTANMVRYCNDWLIPVDNVWEEWESWTQT